MRQQAQTMRRVSLRGSGQIVVNTCSVHTVSLRIGQAQAEIEGNFRIFRFPICLDHSWVLRAHFLHFHMDPIALNTRQVIWASCKRKPSNDMNAHLHISEEEFQQHTSSLFAWKVMGNHRDPPQESGD